MKTMNSFSKHLHRATDRTGARRRGTRGAANHETRWSVLALGAALALVPFSGLVHAEPGPPPARRPFVKLRQDPLTQGPAVVPAGELPEDGEPSATRSSSPVEAFSATTPQAENPGPRCVGRAWYGEPVAGGGWLSPMASMCPASVNARGRIAFVSHVYGSARNQGVFVADKGRLIAIATGCGSEGGSGDPGIGCGDPTPAGGTFSGFFLGTMFVPDLNDAGDVLFIADMVNGRSNRGLFLYDAATRRLVTVAAVGDPSPAGGTFLGIGPGSLNNSGDVVFLANTTAGRESDIFLWKDGVLSRLVGAGDPAPGGGLFVKLGTEAVGFADGTFVPVGPVPDINDAGEIGFRGILTGSLAERGIFTAKGGRIDWVLHSGDPSPGGGSYVDFRAPILNNTGDIAFMADYRAESGEIGSAWFVRSDRGARRALTFYDPIGGGEAMGLAVSRNPMQPLDDQGNLLLWTAIAMPDGGMRDVLLLSAADGTRTILAREGDPTPLGGELGSIQAWPSLRNGRATLSAVTLAAPSGILNAHMLLVNGVGSQPPEVERGLRIAKAKTRLTRPSPGE